MEKDCRRIDFPVILDFARYASRQGICPRYQLTAVIFHLCHPPQDVGHYMAFLKISGQWMRFNDTEVEGINQLAALEDNFPGERSFNSNCNHPPLRVRSMNAPFLE
jgi:hypothetical protein